MLRAYLQPCLTGEPPNRLHRTLGERRGPWLRNAGGLGSWDGSCLRLCCQASASGTAAGCAKSSGLTTELRHPKSPVSSFQWCLKGKRSINYAQEIPPIYTSEECPMWTIFFSQPWIFFHTHFCMYVSPYVFRNFTNGRLLSMCRRWLTALRKGLTLAQESKCARHPAGKTPHSTPQEV